MTFNSAIVPKTTNRTAGHTPYPTFGLPEKRKLNYGSSGKTVRKVSKQRLVSQNDMNSANKMWYDILPDGICAYYATRGYPQGPHGYWAPAVCACSEALSNQHSKWANLVNRLNIKSVLPLLDPMTGQAKKLHFAGGSKSMDIKSIVFIFDKVEDNNEQMCDAICTNLVQEFNNLFGIQISFGGNAAKFGGTVKISLNEIFLTDDVINLAMMAYLDAIEDRSFFQDTELVRQYFGLAENVESLFAAYIA